MPQGWDWTRVQTISIINPRNNISDNTDVSFVSMSLIKEGYANNHSFETRKWIDIKAGFTHFAEHDIAIAKITPCFENKKSVIFRNLINGYGAGTTELHIIRVLTDVIFPEYILWNLKTDAFISNGLKTFTGAVGQKRVGKDFISNTLIPIPPRQEQVRILNLIRVSFEYTFYC